MRNVAARAVLFGRMIRFSHSVFALPFALASAALATRGMVPWREIPWILLAMVGARSAAMGFNRLADHRIDAANPRTAGRELPQGRLSRGEVWAFVLLAAAALVFAAARLNPLCLALSPLALAIVFGYSFTKRFTSLSHLVLGLSLGIAPVGAWLAIRGAFDPVPLVLGGAVLAWVGGFDIIYACQDVEFDRAHGLFSIPARLGVARGLLVARGLHALAVAALLVYEHSLVSADDLRHLDAAFFGVNGWISLGYFVVTAAAARLG